MSGKDSKLKIDLTRPYLVIPKLVEQPTWGGEYIAEAKGWHDRAELKGRKIGQSYEIFSGSNLSFCGSSDDPDFFGELADRDSAQLATKIPNSVPLAELINTSPEDTLGQEIAKQRVGNINLLIKFTQALGNSFQVHLKDGRSDPYWQSKPESWYFFEPGLLTLGIKSGASWDDYQATVEAVDAGMRDISTQIKTGKLSFEGAKPKIQSLIKRYDPWQFVNVVNVGKDGIVDVSAGGIHHSWEEDTERMPLGNILYELQTEAMDDVSTLRSFDKGKIGRDGTVRAVHISEYFRLIDRSSEANDPATYMLQPKVLGTEKAYTLERLFRTKYYDLDRLTLKGINASYKGDIKQFNHLFVKSGQIEAVTATGKVRVGKGHSCFVPAGAKHYEIRCESVDAEVLISK